MAVQQESPVLALRETLSDLILKLELSELNMDWEWSVPPVYDSAMKHLHLSWLVEQLHHLRALKLAEVAQCMMQLLTKLLGKLPTG